MYLGRHIDSSSSPFARFLDTYSTCSLFDFGQLVMRARQDRESGEGFIRTGNDENTKRNGNCIK